MELTGQQTISLPIEKVWAALNDPAILQKCIPGCDNFELTEDNHYNLAMSATVGPIKAKFTGKLVLSDINPPNAYKLTFNGSGGAAGSGKGTAAVQLSSTMQGVILDYAVKATVTGRLSQVGSRLIDGVAKKMADEFFSRFKSNLEPETPMHVEPITTTQTETAQYSPPVPASKKTPLWITVAILVAVGLGVYAILG